MSILWTNPRWRSYGRYSLVTGVLLFLPVLPGQVSFYFFIAMFLAWIETMTIRLRSIATSAPAGRAAPVG